MQQQKHVDEDIKNCTPFADWINKIDNIQVGNARYMDVVMLRFNLIEHSNNYAKTSGSIWQYQKDDPNENIAASK